MGKGKIATQKKNLKYVERKALEKKCTSLNFYVTYYEWIVQATFSTFLKQRSWRLQIPFHFLFSLSFFPLILIRGVSSSQPNPHLNTKRRGNRLLFKNTSFLPASPPFSSSSHLSRTFSAKPKQRQKRRRGEPKVGLWRHHWLPNQQRTLNKLPTELLYAEKKMLIITDWAHKSVPNVQKKHACNV